MDVTRQFPSAGLLLSTVENWNLHVAFFLVYTRYESSSPIWYDLVLKKGFYLI
jgi:hypothetical protein